MGLLGAIGWLWDNKWGRIGLEIAAALAVAGAVTWYLIGIGKGIGREEQKLTEVQTIEEQHKAARSTADADAAASAERVKALEDKVATQNLLLAQLQGTIAGLARERQAAVQQVAALPDADVHPDVVRKLGLRGPGETPACYNFAEERAIDSAVTQLPVCQKQLEANQQDAAETKKKADALESQVVELAAAGKSREAYLGQLEGWYRELYNLHPPIYRSPKCVWLWKCGRRQLNVPAPKN